VREHLAVNPEARQGHLIAMPRERMGAALRTGVLEPTAVQGDGSGFDSVYAMPSGEVPPYTYEGGTQIMRIDANHATAVASIDYATGTAFDANGNAVPIPPDSVVLLPGEAGLGYQAYHYTPDGRFRTAIPTRFMSRWIAHTNTFEPMPTPD
jgi:hypothetical protein